MYEDGPPPLHLVIWTVLTARSDLLTARSDLLTAKSDLLIARSDLLTGPFFRLSLSRIVLFLIFLVQELSCLKLFLSRITLFQMSDFQNCPF